MNLTGRCACGKVRYEVRGEPLVTMACHCLDCQRTTGSAFVIHTTIVESDLAITGETEMGLAPTGSGKGSELHRCADCGVIVWVHYRAIGVGAIAIRAGTLDDPSLVTPAAHIFTSRRPPWVPLPVGVPAYDEGPVRAEVWSAESIDRLNALPPRDSS